MKKDARFMSKDNWIFKNKNSFRYPNVGAFYLSGTDTTFSLSVKNYQIKMPSFKKTMA